MFCGKKAESLGTFGFFLYLCIGNNNHMDYEN